MRIQAIGFNVDPEARQELECIAAAGGGVYRDATDAASAAARSCGCCPRARCASTSRVASRDQGRPERPPGHGAHAGPLHRQDAAGLRALVRDRPRARRDAEGERVVHRRPSARIEDYGTDSLRWTSSRPTSTSRATRTRPRPGRRSSAAGTSSGARRRLAPDRRRRAGRGRPAVLQARPLLPQARLRGLEREGALQRDRRPALRRRARGRGARPLGQGAREGARAEGGARAGRVHARTSRRARRCSRSSAAGWPRPGSRARRVFTFRRRRP